jgi:GMP synthase-like glutamine amidotransferase
MKRRIFCLQHAPFEGPAYIEDWARARNHTFHVVRVFEKQPLPALDDFDFLVVMGGPMGVNDDFKYPWMAAEKALIRQTVEAGKPLLGICLGAQLLASSMDAPVVPNRWPEIGWFPLVATETGKKQPLLDGLDWSNPVFHWHGDTFGIPTGAKHLLKSEACVNQAFLLGTNALALQFHLEMTESALKGMIEHCGDELKSDAPYIQNAGQLLAQTALLEKNNRQLALLLDRLAN